MNIPALIAGLFSGIIGSMGLGGGAVLIIYLTVFCDIGQLKAQGINLLFFIPIAVTSVIIYAFNKRIKWKTVLKTALPGLVGAALFMLLTNAVGDKMLSRLFGAALIIYGVKEFFTKSKEGLAKIKK